jgi:cytochrome c553
MTNLIDDIKLRLAEEGARGGPTVALMQGPAKGLSAAQVRDVAAYLSSLNP